MAITIEQQADDRPPVNQMDSVDAYAREQALQSEADVLEGLRELDGAEGVRWHIFRISDPDLTRNGFLDRWGTDQLTQENLRDKFGPGKYKVRGHYPNGTFAAHRTIEIAGDAPKRGQATNEKPTANAPMDVTQMLLLMDQRDERRRQEEAARRDENQNFWKSLAATLAPIVAPKILDMVTGNRQGGVTELLAGLKQLRELEGTPKTGTSGIKDTLETIALLRDTFDSGGSRPGDKGVWDVLTELAKGAGPKIGAALEALPNLVSAAKSPLPLSAPLATRGISLSPQNSAHAVSPNPSPVLVTDSHSVSGVPAESQTPTSMSTGDGNLSEAESITSPISPRSETPTNGEDMNLALMPHIPFLRKSLELWITKAGQNSDPTLYGGLFMDNLPDGLKQRPQILLPLLERDDWFSILQQLDERVTPFPGWFGELRSYLIEYIKEG